MEVSEDRGPELAGDELDVHHEEIDLNQLLFTFRDAIVELFARVEAIEQRIGPRMATSVKTRRPKRTGR